MGEKEKEENNLRKIYIFPHLICTQILSGVEWRKKIWRRKIYFVSEEEKNKEGE